MTVAWTAFKLMFLTDFGNLCNKLVGILCVRLEVFSSMCLFIMDRAVGITFQSYWLADGVIRVPFIQTYLSCHFVRFENILLQIVTQQQHMDPYLQPYTDSLYETYFSTENVICVINAELIAFSHLTPYQRCQVASRIKQSVTR